MAKTIYDLELNESMKIDEFNDNGGYMESTAVTRVPGGWIYTISNSISLETGVSLAN